MEHSALYRTIWRWHFYAGLLVMPLILVLSITGSAYLFKPQIDRWEEREFRGLGAEGAVSPELQLRAALKAYPGGRFDAYRLPESPGDAAAITIAPANGAAPMLVFVSPQGAVLGTLAPDRRISETIKRVHGTLLMGPVGDRIVELAASWAIVMILTGLYLWWPRDRRLAGVLWPRLSLRGRVFWRDLHAVVGFWVSGLALVMLASGLPWSGVWGNALAAVRAELGLVKGVQEWKIGAGGDDVHAGHAGHHHSGARTGKVTASSDPGPIIDYFVKRAEKERLAFPAQVLPPHAPQTFGPPTGNVWTIKSEAQNRPLDRSVSYDPTTGVEVARSDFADKHPIDRLVGYGIAWHEGQLLGWFNQLVGLLTALMLATLVVSGTVMWWKRKPARSLGAPRPPMSYPHKSGIVGITIVLAALLPLFALSLAFFWLVERLIARAWPDAADWLGIVRRGSVAA